MSATVPSTSPAEAPLTAEQLSVLHHQNAPEAPIQDPRTAFPRPPYSGPLGIGGEKIQEHPGLETEMKYKPDHGEKSYVGHNRLLNKRALITGGDSGIGRAVALAFAREGADVVIQYLSVEEEDAQETRRLCEEAGRKCSLVTADFSTEGEAACRKVVEAAVQALGGRIDILVNNSAHQGKTVNDFSEYSYDRVERHFNTNIVAMIYLTGLALKHMPPGGSILCTASYLGEYSAPVLLDYACTKGAIITFVKGAAQDLASRGLRVNGVAPGPIWTPLTAQTWAPKTVVTWGAATSAVGRAAQPVELAPAYVLLASDESSYVSGEVLGITGGVPVA